MMLSTDEVISLHRRIFIVKDEAPPMDEEVQQYLGLKMRHPGTGRSAGYLLDVRTNQLMELHLMEDGPRSWLIGNRVESAGSIHVGTRYNPLFTALFYLHKSKHAQTTDQLLTDGEYPDTVKLTASLTDDQMQLVAEKRGGDEMCAFKYCERRAMEWLELRTRGVAEALQQADIDAGDSAQADNYIKVTTKEQPADKMSHLKLAHGIVSSYLPASMSAALSARLSLPPDRVTAPRPSDHGQPPPSKKAKGPVDPDEDYSRAATKENVPNVQKTAKQKALAKSATGTKSILSFFGKK